MECSVLFCSEEGEEDEVEGEEVEAVELPKQSSREDKMEWKRAKFRPGTLKRKRFVEHGTDDEDEEDNEAKAPEPIKNKKISPAEAEVTSIYNFHTCAILIFCICYD